MLLGPSGLGKPIWLLVFFEDALLLSIICILFRSEGKDRPKKEKKTKKAEKEVPPTEVDEGERFRNKTCFALSFPTGPQKVLCFSQSIGRRICGRDP